MICNGKELHGLTCFKYNWRSCRWFKANVFFLDVLSVLPNETTTLPVRFRNVMPLQPSKVTILTTCRAHPPKTELVDPQLHQWSANGDTLRCFPVGVAQWRLRLGWGECSCWQQHSPGTPAAIDMRNWDSFCAGLAYKRFTGCFRFNDILKSLLGFPYPLAVCLIFQWLDNMSHWLWIIKDCEVLLVHRKSVHWETLPLSLADTLLHFEGMIIPNSSCKFIMVYKLS